MLCCVPLPLLHLSDCVQYLIFAQSIILPVVLLLFLLLHALFVNDKPKKFSLVFDGEGIIKNVQRRHGRYQANARL